MKHEASDLLNHMMAGGNLTNTSTNTQVNMISGITYKNGIEVDDEEAKMVVYSMLTQPEEWTINVDEQ